MVGSGQLDGSWGYGDISQTTPVNSSCLVDDISALETNLTEVVRDTGLLHSLCLQAFTTVVGPREVISDKQELKNSLNCICSKCGVDEMEQSDIDDLWCGKLNFSEFMLLSKELLGSIKRVMDYGIPISE